MSGPREWIHVLIMIYSMQDSNKHDLTPIPLDENQVVQTLGDIHSWNDVFYYSIVILGNIQWRYNKRHIFTLV